MSSYSATRWWSKWEVIKQVMLYLGDTEPFLQDKEDISPAFWPKLLAFFYDPQTKSKLQVEMAATVDWGEPFVKACYHLKGDGLLALDCFETIDQVIASVATENIPNVRAVAQN